MVGGGCVLGLVLLRASVLAVAGLGFGGCSPCAGGGLLGAGLRSVACGRLVGFGVCAPLKKILMYSFKVIATPRAA